MTTRGLAGNVVLLGQDAIDTEHGPFTVHHAHDLTTGHPVMVVSTGDLTTPEPLLARVHSSCITSEVLLAGDCDCAEQLSAALAHIAAHGRGALFYVIQEGRGAGFVAKARDRMMVQASEQRLTTFTAYAAMGLPADSRRYDAVAGVRRALGITAPLRLLTNNPDKVSEVATAGVPIDGTVPVLPTTTALNRHYLDAKARSGHTIASAVTTIDDAALPEPVLAIEPHGVAGAADWLVLASYLLPLRFERPTWFRLRVHLHRATRAERIVLTHRDPARAAAAPVVTTVRDVLVERLPLTTRPSHRHWQTTAEAIVARGAGAVLLIPPDTNPTPDDETLLAAYAASV